MGDSTSTDLASAAFSHHTRSGQIENARDGDLTVSRAGTLDAAIVTPPTGEAFVVVSMYALWEKPHPTTSSSWIYADGSVHRLISDISVFVGQQLGHRILAAGDLNILHGYGDHGSGYWASRYTTVFDRMRALGLSFVGPQAPAGRRADPWPDELPRTSHNDLTPLVVHFLRESQAHCQSFDERRLDGLRRWRAVAQRAVGSYGVVLPPPPFDQDLRFGQGVEDLTVEQLVA